MSLVIVNDDKGKYLLENCQDRLSNIQTSIENSMQIPLIKPFEQPASRDDFWRDYTSKDFAFIAKKYRG